MKNKLICVIIVSLILISFIIGLTQAIDKKCLPEDQVAKQISKNIIGAENIITKYEPKLKLAQKMIEVPKGFKEKILGPLAKKYPDIDLSKSQVVLRKIEGHGDFGDFYRLDIQLIDKKGKPITFSKSGMSSYMRTFSFDKEGNLIVENDLLFIAEGYRNQGIATEIYALEEEFYKSLGVKKVHINAVSDGRAMWAKKEFGFKFQKPADVGEKWVKWLNTDAGKNWVKRTGGYDKPLGNNPYLYPREFLNTFSEIQYVKTY